MPVRNPRPRRRTEMPYSLEPRPTGHEVIEAMRTLRPYSRKHRAPGKTLKQAFMETLWEVWRLDDVPTRDIMVKSCVIVMENHLIDSKVKAPARPLLYQPARLN